MPQIRLYGPPSVTAHDGALPVPLSAREAGLLAWLQIEGPTARARIAGLLWPGGTEAQARANLRQTLARLRRTAGALVAEADGLLQLAPDADARPDPHEPRPLLDGLAFDDAPEFAQWLGARREDAQRERQRRLLALGREQLAAHEGDAALAAADTLLAEQPENEEAWRLRMEVLYQRGDRAGAVAAWDACRHVLRSAFGIAPSAATNALGQLILASDDAAGAARRALLPAALRRPPQRVGREALVQALERAMALGRSVVISAAGGMGKSRLLQQLAAGDGVLAVSARPGDAQQAGELLGRLLRAALDRFQPVLDEATGPALAPLLPGEGGIETGVGLRSELEHRQVLAALQRALDACRQAGLQRLLIDDLHWADEASLTLLQPLAGRWLAMAGETGAPQLVLACRGDELGTAGQALVALVVQHGAGSRFELLPLSRDEVRALVTSLPGRPEGMGPADHTAALADALHAAVGGNPAFVLEALRSLWLDGAAGWRPGAPLPVPPTLVASVQARLQRLPAEVLQLAQLAAVAAGDFDTALAAAAFGRSPLALAPLFAALESAQVFHGSAFSHDLVLDAVQRSLPQALAAPLHGLVASHLVAQGGAPGRIAHHLLAAGPARAAAPWLVRAADAARGRWQLAEAVAAYTAAARAFDPAAHASTDRAPAFAAWMAALRWGLRLRQLLPAQAALDAATALVRSPAEQALLQARRVQLALVSSRFGEAALGADTLVDALAAAADELDADEAVHALRTACTAVQHGLPAGRVLPLCERLRPRLQAAGPQAAAGLALARSGPLLWDAWPRASAEDLEAVWPTIGEGTDPDLRRSVANQLMRVRQALGDLDGAHALGQVLRGLLLADEQDAVYAADALALLGQITLARGGVAAAFALFDEAGVRLQAAGMAVPELIALIQALACTTAGLHARAQALLEAHTPAPGRSGQALYDQVQHLARARLAQARGEPVAPWAEALRALPVPSAGAQLHRRVILAGLGQAPRAELEALLQAVSERGQLGLQRTVALSAASAALAEGDRPAARRHAVAALALAAHVDAWCDEPARVWLEAGDVLQGCGEEAAARRAWQAGAAWVLQAAAGLADPALRRAWCEQQPRHRALLERCD